MGIGAGFDGGIDDEAQEIGGFLYAAGQVPAVQQVAHQGAGEHIPGAAGGKRLLRYPIGFREQGIAFHAGDADLAFGAGHAGDNNRLGPQLQQFFAQGIQVVVRGGLGLVGRPRQQAGFRIVGGDQRGFGHQLLHGVHHGFVEHRVQLAVVPHGRVHDHQLVTGGKPVDGGNHGFHLARAGQKTAVDGVKGQLQLLPLVHIGRHQVRQIPGNEFAIGQVVAVKRRRERADLVPHGRKHRDSGRQRATAERTQVMDGQYTFYFHG